MTKKQPYQVIKHQYVTEKTRVLQNLQTAKNNLSVSRCKNPKYVFVVDRNANKNEIAQSLEEIYMNEGIKVLAVNTINVKAKPKRMRAGKRTFNSAYKKAIVTLRPGDMLEKV